MKKVFGIFMVLLALAFVSCSNAAGSDGDDGAGDNSAVSDEATSNEAASGSGGEAVIENTFPVVFSRTGRGESESFTFNENGTGTNVYTKASAEPRRYPLTWTGSLSASGSGTVIIKYSETKIEDPSFSISADGRTMTVDWHNEGEDLEIFTRQ